MTISILLRYAIAVFIYFKYENILFKDFRIWIWYKIIASNNVKHFK